ncbi:MAG: prenyltransferase/squalene oxidase repeat-containing protein [Planctomycetaceae bacterium]
MLRWHRLLLAFVLAFGLVSSSAQAQISPQIDQARLKGIEFLKGEQYEDGSWSLTDHDVGITALCALALIENGVPVSDEVIEKAQRFIKKEMDETDGTCDIALAILFMHRVGGRDSRPEIRELAARLIAGQNVEGGWGGTCPKASAGILSNPDERPKPQAGVGDNISTQFAVQGLWAASSWGVDIRETMSQVSDRFAETQREDGGWPVLCEEWTKLLPAEEQKKREAQRAAVETKEAEAKATAKKKPEKVKKKARSKSDEDDAPAEEPAFGKGGFGRNDNEEPGFAPAAPGAPKDYQPTDPAMTFAGLYCLAVAQAADVQHKKANPPKAGATAAPGTATPAAVTAEQSLLADPSFADGLKVANQFATKMGASSSCHYFWSVERLGVVLAMEKFGDANWYELGAAALLKSQTENGSWGTAAKTSEEKSSKKPDEGAPVKKAEESTSYGLTGNLADTSFALLFLRKASLGSDISRLLQGEQSEPFQVVTQSGQQRFKTLEEAIKTAKAGDRIRIEGSGPYQLSHIDIDRDLTLEAGYGYQPILQYDVGFDSDGRRSRPQDNPETRHMLRVTSGTLTLEGLDIQMDAPDLGAKVPWAAVVAQGGSLRVLNCSISEGNKQGMASIQVTGPAAVTLQNSQLIGGRAGMEILVSGEPKITLNNCIVFSHIGFKVQDGEKSEGGQCRLTMNRCAVQTQDVFYCKDLKSSLDIECHGVAFQSEWMGQNMLTAATGHPGMTWKGSDNLYDIKRWVGHAAKPNATVKDAKSFNTFWGGSDENGSGKSIPFAVRRPIGGFNHVVKGEDYEFSASSSVHAQRKKTGIDPLIVGPGPGFQRFRESFDYRIWSTAAGATAAVESSEKPASTPDASPSPAPEPAPKK